MPLWQTTVVVEPCGTTTVVFCGGGGLELLMHPASNPAAAMALNSAFIIDSCTACCALELWRVSASRGRSGSLVPVSSRVLRPLVVLLQERACFEDSESTAARAPEVSSSP